MSKCNFEEHSYESKYGPRVKRTKTDSSIVLGESFPNIAEDTTQDNSLKQSRVQNESPQTESIKSKPKQGPKYKALSANQRRNINLECEWNMCNFQGKKMETFMRHIEDHVAEEIGGSINDGYLCFWRNCGFNCEQKEELDRHIYYHGFHTKIKSCGEMVYKMNALQCQLDYDGHNMIPDIPNGFYCLWQDCPHSNHKFDSAQHFYWHVNNHCCALDKCAIKDKSNNNRTESNKGKKYFHCYWEGCNSKSSFTSRLLDHVRTHTQEKLFACPTCGGIFSTHSKLIDHSYRTQNTEEAKFQCSHCSHRFATERLLKEHDRRHVNHFKCPLCAMTCPTRSAIEAHLKYRHNDDKPFDCPHCSCAYKSQSDLVRHMLQHTNQQKLCCQVEGCDFSCSHQNTFEKHMLMVHSAQPRYQCHLCSTKANIGYLLTKHLFSDHNLQWPSGFKRFRYILGEDGFYRLQTTRFESIELAQELLGEGEGEVEEGADEPAEMREEQRNVTDEGKERQVE